MNKDEAETHLMLLIYHMLGMVNEIRIICNARISDNCESEELKIEQQKAAEKYLSEKVADKLNCLLSNENLQLDSNTSRELVMLTGGGIHLEGKYIPVQVTKIQEALKAIPIATDNDIHGAI